MSTSFDLFLWVLEEPSLVENTIYDPQEQNIFCKLAISSADWTKMNIFVKAPLLY